MNPFSPTFSHPFDIISSWLVACVVVASIVRLRRRLPECEQSRLERDRMSFLRACLFLYGAVAGVFVITWIFLIQWPVTTSLWLFWPLAYGLSVVMLGWVFPVLLLVSLGWTLVGKLSKGCNWRVIRFAAIGCLVFTFDVCFYIYVLQTVT